MRSIWKKYTGAIKRQWIRRFGLPREAQAQVAEQAQGKAYYAFFDEIYSKAHQAGAKGLFDRDIYVLIERVIEEFLTRYAFDPRATQAIDFGCGEGGNALYIARRGFHITGVDVSPAAILRARENAAQADVPAQYVVGDVLDLRSFSDDRFDFGVNIGCLHMLVTDDHRRRHLREMWRVLKPGGLLLSFNNLSRRDVVIENPDRYIYSFLAVDETKQIEVEGQRKEIRFHGVGFRDASAAQYRAEFEGAGFAILKTEPLRTGRRGWKQFLRLGFTSGQRYLALHARKK